MPSSRQCSKIMGYRTSVMGFPMQVLPVTRLCRQLQEPNTDDTPSLQECLTYHIYTLLVCRQKYLYFINRLSVVQVNQSPWAWYLREIPSILIRYSYRGILTCFPLPFYLSQLTCDLPVCIIIHQSSPLQEGHGLAGYASLTCMCQCHLPISVALSHDIRDLLAQIPYLTHTMACLRSSSGSRGIIHPLKLMWFPCWCPYFVLME